MLAKADHKRSYANRLGFVAAHGGAPAKPVNSAAPSVTGTAQVGETLTHVAGTWTGRPTPAVTAEWLKDGAADAVGATRVLTEADEGAVFAVRETALNAAGGVAATSADTAEVLPED